MKSFMKVAMATTLFTSIAGSALAEDIKLGVFFGFTGPIESIVADMGPAAELAIKEVSDSGALLGGSTVTGVRGDTTCIDSAAATATAERLITSDGVKAIIGGDCSGVTTAIANNVGIPNGVVMVSPSATSPALSTIDDKGFFFRANLHAHKSKTHQITAGATFK